MTQSGSRIVFENVQPEVDGGQFPIKRTVGETVNVEADIYADGHDVLAGVLRYRHERASDWNEIPLSPLGNDRWGASFVVTELGRYRYTLRAWIDRFASWSRDLARKVEAGQDVSVDLCIGADLVEEAARRAPPSDGPGILRWAALLRGGGDAAVGVALSPELAALMARYPVAECVASYHRELEVIVDRVRARFSAWYEMFPRSAAPVPGRHGTLADCEARLPYVASMGFDVLYLPPIHPIGRTHRRGKNNAETAGPDDPGSPWAIGSAEGGHTAIHPQLGTLEDFRRLMERARSFGIEVAMDLAFHCSPDHPYVREHPEWFRWRPDGTVQYAENPPKKYQDIYPFNFETPAWRTLWDELLGVVRFWIGQGVRIFRVDNPHTKPFAFWEWLIREVTREYPDVLFLSEAFTRPKIMYRLAKVGFTQSYTYFAWRNTKAELVTYFTELTQTPLREFFRPHLWPNTPDILTEYLQRGGPPAFAIRFVLAATLGAGYGIYGPAFELCENRPLAAGSEEYLDSEKYEIRYWDLERPGNLRPLISRVNSIRRENPALHSDWTLHFHGIDNDNLICYSKHTPDRRNVILMVVNLDPHHTQAGWTNLSLDVLGLRPDEPFQVHDLLNGPSYTWRGSCNDVELDPASTVAHVFRIAGERRP